MNKVENEIFQVKFIFKKLNENEFNKYNLKTDIAKSIKNKNIINNNNNNFSNAYNIISIGNISNLSLNTNKYEINELRKNDYNKDDLLENLESDPHNKGLHSILFSLRFLTMIFLFFEIIG